MLPLRASLLFSGFLLASCGGSTNQTGTDGAPGQNGGAGGSSAGTSSQGGTSSAGTSSQGTGGNSAGGTSSQGQGGTSSAGTSSQGIGGNSVGGTSSQGQGGSSTAGTSSQGVGGAAVGGTSSQGGSSTGGASTGPCPSDPPSPGDVCSGDLVCTYGDNPVADCRQRFVCSNGAFQDESTGAVCPAPGTGNCPATDPTDNASCGATGDPFFVCGYPDSTVCACAVCVGGPVCEMDKPPTWHCGNGSSNAPKCPSQLPNAGTSCEVEGTGCVYGLTCGGGGQAVMCESGAWKWVETPCPG